MEDAETAWLRPENDAAPHETWRSRYHEDVVAGHHRVELVDESAAAIRHIVLVPDDGEVEEDGDREEEE